MVKLKCSFIQILFLVKQKFLNMKDRQVTLKHGKQRKEDIAEEKNNSKFLS